jgi:polysaccharide biosynthesis transport protein
VSVQQYVLLLRERWLTVLVTAVLGLAGGAVAFALLPAEYTASTTLYVSTRLTDTTSAAYQGAQLSELRAKSYTELVGSPRVAAEVAQRLGLSRSAESLASQVTATSAADSVVIQVAATDRSPELAAEIANGVGAVFVDFVEELEDPTGPDAMTAPISVQVWEPAAVPSTPSSLGLRSMLLIGLLTGLAAGVVAALVRKTLDTSVRSVEQLARVTRAPNFSVFAHEPDVRRHPVTVRYDPAGAHAEAIHRLRIQLEVLGGDGAHRILAVTSSVPGEGKTTIAVNLAMAFGSVGYRVVLVEADLRRPAVAEMVGLDQQVGLSQVLMGRADLADAIQDSLMGIDVLAAGPPPPNPGEHVGARAMKARLNELRHAYDIVLVDCPSLLSVADTAAVLPATDGAIVVCRHRRVTEAQLSAALSILRTEFVPVLGTVLTMVPPKTIRNLAPDGGRPDGRGPAGTNGGRSRHSVWTAPEQTTPARESDAVRRSDGS